MQINEMLGLAFPDATFEQIEQAIAVLNGEVCEYCGHSDNDRCDPWCFARADHVHPSWRCPKYRRKD